MADQFAQNPHYVAYERLLLKLHELIAQGQGDSDEAEAVRDAMELPESHLSPDELERLGGLSADLYMLQDDEVFEEATSEERSEENLGLLIVLAVLDKKWVRLLALLRKGPPFLKRGDFAHLRARAYLALGHEDVSLVFDRYASHLDPNQFSVQRTIADDHASEITPKSISINSTEIFI